MSEYKPLAEALQNKVGGFLSWPQYKEYETQNRVKQLETLGVQAIAIGGPHEILGTPILGKGHTGIVIKAIHKGQVAALKIRRTDTDRQSMTREANFLAHANKWNVGPKLYGFSNDFIVMELIIGQYFGNWITDNLDNRKLVIKHINELLGIAWRLDQSGLDHGELTRIKRHYIVTDTGPRVIDFESASLERTPNNVTSTVQSLFFNYRFAKLLEKINPKPDREYLLKTLKRYKQKPVKENYDTILKACNL